MKKNFDGAIFNILLSMPRVIQQTDAVIFLAKMIFIRERRREFQ
jgi:hypothetical protein